MFMGAFDQPIPWSTNGLIGMSRFLTRVWEQQDKVAADAPADDAACRLLQQTIKHVGERMEAMKFNTAIAALMTLANDFAARDRIPREHWETFLTLLSPFAPHISEELWSALGKSNLVCRQAWPSYDPEQAREVEMVIPVQVNGKLRGRIRLSADADEAEAVEMALADEQVQRHLAGKTVRKTIYVKGRLLNLVIG
jgi:leucyl-tRNA synthetase